MTTNNLLIILFAVLDCRAWSHVQLTDWTDRLIAKLEHPRSWLADLSMSSSVDDALEVIREVMKEAGVVLPDDIGDLMVGLVLLRFDRADISAETARSLLVDIVDAYGANFVDAEAAGHLDLKNPVYSQARESAKHVIGYLNGGKFPTIAG